MEKSEICFDPKLSSDGSWIEVWYGGSTGGFDCPLCKENKNYCHSIFNKKKETIQFCEDCFGLFFSTL